MTTYYRIEWESGILYHGDPILVLDSAGHEGVLVPVPGLIVPADIDYGYILDWALDVGGPNYMTDMDEVKDVILAAAGKEEPIVLDDYERGVLDRALDKMEAIGKEER